MINEHTMCGRCHEVKDVCVSIGMTAVRAFLFGGNTNAPEVQIELCDECLSQLRTVLKVHKQDARQATRGVTMPGTGYRR